MKRLKSVSYVQSFLPTEPQQVSKICLNCHIGLLLCLSPLSKSWCVLIKLFANMCIFVLCLLFVWCEFPCSQENLTTIHFRFVIANIFACSVSVYLCLESGIWFVSLLLHPYIVGLIWSSFSVIATCDDFSLWRIFWILSQVKLFSQVGIYGISGVGKTTLLTQINTFSDTCGGFEVVIWAWAYGGWWPLNFAGVSVCSLMNLQLVLEEITTLFLKKNDSLIHISLDFCRYAHCPGPFRELKSPEPAGTNNRVGLLALSLLVMDIHKAPTSWIARVEKSHTFEVGLHEET